MITFIDDNRGSYGIEPICAVLPIAPLSARARRDMTLKVEVARVFKENFGVYDVRKVWRQMPVLDALEQALHDRRPVHRGGSAPGDGRRRPGNAGAYREKGS